LVDFLNVKLTSEDSLFKRVRDMSLPGLGLVTKELLLELQGIKTSQNEAQSIKEMSEYIKKVKEMDVQKTKYLLDSHTNLATHLSRQLRDTERL
jgi:hypothetical protein